MSPVIRKVLLSKIVIEITTHASRPCLPNPIFFYVKTCVLNSIYMGYWPSVRSRWQDIGQVLFFCVFMDRDEDEDRDEVEVHKHAKKRTRPISRHLDRTSLVNKEFIIWLFSSTEMEASYMQNQWRTLKSFHWFKSITSDCQILEWIELK